MRFHNNKIFKVVDSEDSEYIEKALKISFISGFYSTSSRFPVASSEKGINMENVNPEDLINVPQNNTPEKYTASSDSAVYLKELNDNSKKGLESLFDKGFVLSDENNDLLADSMNVRFDIKNLNDKSVLAAACNMTFRYGMSVTSFSGKLIADEDYKGSRIVFEGTGEPSIKFTDGQAKIIHVYGKGLRLEKFAAKLCQELPEMGCGYTWTNYKEDFFNSFKLRNLDGQLSYAKTFMSSSDDESTVYAEPNLDVRYDKYKDEFKKTKFINFKGNRKIYSKEYDISWEVDELRGVVKDELIPKLKVGSRVKIIAAVSENKDVRDKLKTEITKMLSNLGFDVDIEIICAYKQGYSWISDVIVPKLKGKNASEIKVRFKPFLPEDQTEWAEEDGATPSYSNFGSYDENKWYDLPIRFLQELYPIDEVAARELGISKDDIKFEYYEDFEDITYELIAFDKSGNTLLNEQYKVETYERPYISEMPGLGKVHPATGYLKAYCEGTEIINRQIRTDTDKVWEIFQNEILPESKKFVLDKYNGRVTSDNEPFFSKLEIKAELSEPNFRTGTREDMISSLDALHEDMYFVATDYYKNFGFIESGVPFEAPGLILPDLRESEGKPKLIVTLYGTEAEHAGVLKDGKFFTYKAESPEMYVDEINFNQNDELNYNIKTENCDKNMLKEYFDLMSKGVLEASEQTSYISSMSIKEYGISCTKQTEERAEVNIERDVEIIRGIDFKEGSVIGYDDYIKIINELKKVSCLKVYIAGKSYNGRLIYGIDIIPEGETGFVSEVKSLTYNPSELINCRHHANEVSSTNASFRIIKELVCNPESRKIADNLNITIIPVENVDGAALHYQLMQINPNWKFHVARFDGLSKEFFREIFNKDSIHTEAHAFGRIYKRILPDLIVDNHGVPSHEWEQQYSGYTSPSYKGFWLPRSILYGYFWPPKEDEFKDNIILCNKLQDEVSYEIGLHKELKELNLEWAERFEKYAHNWMPKLFPADYYNGMIFYWIYKNHSADASYVSWRHPWINTAYFTSEVADETAQGNYLKTCTDAHFYHNMRILNVMSGVKKSYRYEYNDLGDKLVLKLTRQRPIFV